MSGSLQPSTTSPAAVSGGNVTERPGRTSQTFTMADQSARSRSGPLEGVQSTPSGASKASAKSAKSLTTSGRR